MTKKIFLFISVFFAAFSINAQNTVGLLSFDNYKAHEGYNLFFPHAQTDVFLLDNCGQIVHTWEGETYRPGNTVFLTEEGKLYKTGSRGAGSNEWIHAGGGGEVVQIIDWDGNIEWEYAVNDSMQRMHHDIAVKPNGNILMIVWERFLEEDALQAGRNPALMEDNEVWSEKIIEVQPNLETGEGEIVWEWRVWDHLVQDFDETKDNFGVVANNKEKMNLNYVGSAEASADWLHINSIDYNPYFDQILLSVPTINEIWIIDQSTSTTQAAGSTGGLSGQGGDILYRYGNPAAYDRGTEEDQVCFYQHDAHWIDLNFVNGDPDFGKIMLFNNQVTDSTSTVDIVNVIFDSYEGGFLENSNGAYEPLAPLSIYATEDPTKMHSTGLSGAQKLKNGNTLICVGREGYIFEVTEEGEIVWEFKNPMRAGLAVSQGEELQTNDNLVFRMYRYETDFPAFEGKDLSQKGYIELNPNMEACNVVSSNQAIENIENALQVAPNPFKNNLNITTNEIQGELTVLNILGQIQFQSTVDANQQLNINTQTWIAGTYLVLLNNQVVDKVVLVK